jgi:hypothetical protein
MELEETAEVDIRFSFETVLGHESVPSIELIGDQSENFSQTE